MTAGRYELPKTNFMKGFATYAKPNAAGNDNIAEYLIVFWNTFFSLILSFICVNTGNRTPVRVIKAATAKTAEKAAL